MHIVLSSDDNYVQHLGVNIQSILLNNKEINNITIHILDSGISYKNKKHILEMVRNSEHSIKFYDCTNMKKFMGNINIDVRSMAMYSRVFIPNILDDNIEKIIYMDIDSVVEGSLQEVWDIDLDNDLIAGVVDTIPNTYKEIIGLEKDDIYINSGFLLVNIKQWRIENIIDKLLTFIKENDGNATHYDQGAINYVCKGRVKKLHPKYNVMTTFYTIKYKNILKLYDLDNYYSKKEIDEAIKTPVFIHYVPGFITRPWIKRCKHPKANLYMKYLEKTPWIENGLQDDNRSIKVKLMCLLYNLLPFNIFNILYSTINKIKY